MATKESNIKAKYLLSRLKTISKRYGQLIDECALLKTDAPQKKMFLRIANLLEGESTAIKKTLGILTDDPCPYSKTEHQNSRVCSSCEEEEEHIRDGTITPFKRRGLPL